MNTDYIIGKFAEDIARDEYNSTTESEAVEILEHEINGIGKIPEYVMNGDITAFRCSWSVYTEEELLSNFNWVSDDGLEQLKNELRDRTSFIELTNGKYAVLEF